MLFGLLKKEPTHYKNIGPEEFERLKNEEESVVLDVRSAQELKEGVIDNYINHNVFSADFKKEIANLDKTKNYLIYCRSGNRSARACQIMHKMGFKNLYNLKGGIKAWNKHVS